GLADPPVVPVDRAAAGRDVPHDDAPHVRSVTRAPAVRDAPHAPGGAAVTVLAHQVHGGTRPFVFTAVPGPPARATHARRTPLVPGGPAVHGGSMADIVTSLFRSSAAHSPSMAALTRESDGAGPVDFCIPCNPYFPTPAMFEEMAARLREIITYYPSG